MRFIAILWVIGLVLSGLATHQRSLAQVNRPGADVIGNASRTSIDAGRARVESEGLSDHLGELQSDRPGFTEPSAVLPGGVAQVECGFSFTSESTDAARTRSLILGSPLVRLGIGHRAELRFGGEGFLTRSVRSPAGESRARGAADFGIGAKLGLMDERKLLPAFSVIPILSLPMGHRDLTSSAYDPTVKFAWSKQLPRGFSAGGNVNFSSLTDGDGRLFQRAHSLSLEHGLPRGFGGYWEAYQVSPTERDAAGAWTVNTGVTHLVGKDAQIDVAVGRAMRPSCPCWFVGIGLAVRMPLSLHERGK